MTDTYIFRKMKNEDLEFFLSIRNECSELLHNDSKFTMNEVKKWFNETLPFFYIINYNNEDVGYFRTSNYSMEFNTIYIGCDLHEKWRGKKIAYNGYINFMMYIIKKLKIEKFYLEVFSTNIIAYNLYKKLGFTEDNIEYNKVLRNNQYINNISMSITTNVFLKMINKK
jgi:RimJ/RimL family protein N-acetyltransferase